MWANACGDGIAAAYNAGAEMRNAEFGNFYDVTNRGTGIPIVFGFNSLCNAQGENISAKYIQGMQPDIPISIILGMEKEVMEGRGPIYFDGWVCQGMGGGGGFKWTDPIPSAFGVSLKGTEVWPAASEKLKFLSDLPASFRPSGRYEMKTTFRGFGLLETRAMRVGMGRCNRARRDD
jgi:hypothetical protein